MPTKHKRAKRTQTKPVPAPLFAPKPETAGLLHLAAKAALDVIDELSRQGALRLPFPRFNETYALLRKVVDLSTAEEVEWLHSMAARTRH